jgi:hypothetical protein
LPAVQLLGGVTPVPAATGYGSAYFKGGNQLLGGVTKVSSGVVYGGIVLHVGRLLYGGLTPISFANVYYKMVGMDATINNLYDGWVSVSSPDPIGASYMGSLNTPLRNIHIEAIWNFLR